MNERDKLWLEKCKNSDKYEITVDNDCIWVSEVNPYEEDTKEWYAFDGGENYTFSTWGEEFIIELLKLIGIKADRC